jgi:hypothetical protein
MLPFTRDAFLALFEEYNAAIWPAQVIACALGLLILVLVLRPVAGSGRLVAALLALAWLWNGLVFHGIHFARINFWAYGFAALFVLQGLLFAVAALRDRPAWRFERDAAGWTGFVLAGLALLYPLIGMVFGHGWPRTAIFGVAPDPTTIFTWGLLLTAQPRPPIHLTVVPLAWSLIAAGLALGLGFTEDLALLFAAGLALALTLRRMGRAAGA